MATDKPNAIPTWNEVKQLHPGIVELNTGYNDNNVSTAKELLNLITRSLVEIMQSEEPNCILFLKMSSDVKERQYNVVSYSRTGSEIMVIYLSGYIHDDIGKKYKYDMSNGMWSEVQ